MMRSADIRCMRTGKRRTRTASSGFTLVETLLALLIFVVLATIVCAGIPAAWRTYTDAVDVSNAQVLLSTTTTTLRSELNRATSVDATASSNSEIAFDTGEGYRVELDGSENGIKKTMYPYTVDADGKRTKDEARKTEAELVTKAIRTESLSITFSKIEFDKKTGVFSISGLQVQRGNDVLATAGTDGDTFKVKTISSEARNED